MIALILFKASVVAEELFDVVDECDRFREILPRSEVHARRLFHRAVHIFVRNTRGDLLVHRRSATKDELPLKVTSSASGHVSAGEDYDESAVRELGEELGLYASPRFLAKFPASEATSLEHTALYEVVTDAPPVFDPGEIESGEFLSIDEIRRRIAACPDDFTPAFRLLFAWYHESLGLPSLPSV